MFKSTKVQQLSLYLNIVDTFRSLVKTKLADFLLKKV